MYTVQYIFNSSMDIMNKKLPSGVIDANATSLYKGRTIGIVNMWQEELALELMEYIPVPLTQLTDEVTFDYISCASNYLASRLLLQENVDEANFFEQKYLELKNLIVRKTRPATIEPIIDVYGAW